MGYTNIDTLKGTLESLIASSPLSEITNDIATVIDDIGLGAQVLQLLEAKVMARLGLTDAAALKQYLTDDAAKAAEAQADGLEALRLAAAAGSK